MARTYTPWDDNDPLGSTLANQIDDKARRLRVEIREVVNQLLGISEATAMADPVLAAYDGILHDNYVVNTRYNPGTCNSAIGVGLVNVLWSSASYNPKSLWSAGAPEKLAQVTSTLAGIWFASFSVSLRIVSGAPQGRVVLSWFDATPTQTIFAECPFTDIDPGVPVMYTCSGAFKTTGTYPGFFEATVYNDTASTTLEICVAQGTAVRLWKGI